MKARLAITYIFNLIDLIATMYLVSLFGLSIEANPIGRRLIQTNLVYPFKIVVIGGLLLAIGLLSEKNRRMADVCSWILLIIFLGLTIYHFVILINI